MRWSKDVGKVLFVDVRVDVAESAQLELLVLERELRIVDEVVDELDERLCCRLLGRFFELLARDLLAKERLCNREKEQ